MKSILFLICCAGVLSLFLDKSFAEGFPALSGNTPAVQRDAAVLLNGDYMLAVSDYEELKEKGGLLVQYPARQKNYGRALLFILKTEREEKWTPWWNLRPAIPEPGKR